MGHAGILKQFKLAENITPKTTGHGMKIKIKGTQLSVKSMSL
jgi:hypothetical protein